MASPPPSRRPTGFTFVELLLALALSAVVAAILAALLHGLLVAGEGQSARARGPYAAKNALRQIARDAACAFAPPVADLKPMELSTSPDPAQPEIRLAFYVPAPADTAWRHAYDIHHVVFEVRRQPDGLRELHRIAAPCSGPFTNSPTTNLLLSGRFTLAIEALTNDTPHAEWPLPDAQPPFPLPSALRLALDLRGHDPLQTEVLLQTAWGIPSPIPRTPAEEKEK